MTKLELVDFEAGLSDEEAAEAKRRWEAFPHLMIIARAYIRICDKMHVACPILKIIVGELERGN